MEKNGCNASSPVDSDRVFADGTLHDANVKGFEGGVFDEFFEDERKSDLADHVGGDIEALDFGGVE